MGAVKVDISAGERRFEERYALDNPTGVRLLLSEYHSLVGRQYQGDYDATVLIVDLAKAIDLAKLTGRQHQALRLVYVEDLTLESAGKRMGGIAKQSVDDYVDTAVGKIAEIYFYWAGHGEGYTTTVTMGETE